MLFFMVPFSGIIMQLSAIQAYVPTSAITCMIPSRRVEHRQVGNHEFRRYATQRAESDDEDNEATLDDFPGECNQRFPKEASAAVEDRDDHLRIIDNSLRKHSGQGIYERMFGEDAERVPRDVHTNTRWVVVSHDKGDTTPASVLGNEGPIFNYGNFATLAQFRMKWDEFTCLPSKYAAEMGSDREARVKLLQQVTDDGYADETSGIVRVAGDGTRFFVPRFAVWNTYDDDGNYYGQACLFDRDECRPAD